MGPTTPLSAQRSVGSSLPVLPSPPPHLLVQPGGSEYQVQGEHDKPHSYLTALQRKRNKILLAALLTPESNIRYGLSLCDFSKFYDCKFVTTPVFKIKHALARVAVALQAFAVSPVLLIFALVNMDLHLYYRFGQSATLVAFKGIHALALAMSTNLAIFRLDHLSTLSGQERGHTDPLTPHTHIQALPLYI